MSRIDTRSDFAQIARLPRGVVIIIAAIVSWLVVALVWMGGTRLFGFLVALF